MASLWNDFLVEIDKCKSLIVSCFFLKSGIDLLFQSQNGGAPFMKSNILLNVDSYKASHYLQYPPKTERISSYIESRGGQFSKTIFFGLQYFIKKHLITPITEADISEASLLFKQHGLPFNEGGWRYILHQHKGFLPVEIQAVPEGSLIPTQNVLVQMVNTDTQCAWLTSYLETALLRSVWYPTTVSTLSFHCKRIIAEYLRETASSLDGLNFKLHDFGARGVSSEESAAIGGLSHLVCFMGTDTISGILAAKHFYHEPMAGYSIPAAEHSTITAWGKGREVEAYENMVDRFSGENQLFAVVSDSYDLFYALEHHWGSTLKSKIESMGGTLVIRPDSGDPVDIVSLTIETLIDRFGCVKNAKGYKVLPPYLRVIQGDGISINSIKHILESLKKKGISAENVAFGMGGELLQKVHRDTLKFAMKASAIQIKGEWSDIYKDPATDPGKRSKKGRLALVKHDNEFLTVRESESIKAGDNLLRTVFKNGKLYFDESLSQIRERVNGCIVSD